MRNNIWYALTGMLVLVGGLSGPGTPALASTFTACVAPGTVNCVLGPSPASGSFSNNTSGSGSSSASAFSSGGILGGSASATSTGTTVASNTNAATFMANAIIDDLIISGPATQASVQVSANLDGLGSLSGLNVTDATATVRATLQISLANSDSSPLVVYTAAFGTDTPVPAINTTLTTSAITLPTNTNLVVEMFLKGSVVASDNFGPGSASASLDFLNTMSFPTSGPVFTLPVGFTANSISGNIVDNQFVGVVPLPAAYWLFGSGLLGLVGVARRKKA